MSESTQVGLRALEIGDSDRLLAWRNLPDVRRWMYTDHVISPAEHDRWFTGTFGDAARRYWIIELEGRPVGLANLTGLVPEHRRATMGYYVADPSLRGRGIAAGANFRVIDYAFGDLSLNRLWCEALVENTASVRLLESLGFQREALFRAHVWKDGQPADVVGLGLLADDWAKLREECRAKLAAKGLRV